MASKCFDDFGERGMRLVKQSFIEGGRLLFYNQKFTILLWGTNALLALILTIPIYSLLTVDLSHSLLSDVLVNKLDYVWLLQFYHNYNLEINQIPILLYGIVFIYILINTFYDGGIITVFVNPSKNHWVDFFYGGVRYWYRFIKVVLISAVFYLLVFLLYYWSGKITGKLFQETPSYWTPFIFRLVRYILLLFFVGIVTVIADYTKIALAANGRLKALNEFWQSTKFVFKNFNIVFGVFFLVAFLGALGAILYNLIGLAIPASPFYFLILTFLLQQLLIIFRLNIRMFFFATEINLCRELRAEVIEQEAIETEGI